MPGTRSSPRTSRQHYDLAMTILRGLLASFLVVTWAACVATYVADLHEDLLIGLVPAVVPLVLSGTLPFDDDNLGHLIVVALLALLQVAVVHALALAVHATHARNAGTP